MTDLFKNVRKALEPNASSEFVSDCIDLVCAEREKHLNRLKNLEEKKTNSDVLVSGNFDKINLECNEVRSEVERFDLIVPKLEKHYKSALQQERKTEVSGKVGSAHKVIEAAATDWDVYSAESQRRAAFHVAEKILEDYLSQINAEAESIEIESTLPSDLITGIIGKDTMRYIPWKRAQIMGRNGYLLFNKGVIEQGALAPAIEDIAADFLRKWGVPDEFIENTGLATKPPTEPENLISKAVRSAGNLLPAPRNDQERKSA